VVSILVLMDFPV